MRILKEIAAALLLLAVAVWVFITFIRKPEVVYVEDIKQVAVLRSKVLRDSLRRVVLEKTIALKQREIDSLDALAKKLRTLPLPKVDSIAKVKPIRKDSLTCLSESDYRRLVIGSFGEEKYSLCLGQLQAKDSILFDYKQTLSRSMTTMDFMSDRHKKIHLELSEVKRDRVYWAFGGLLAGALIGLLVGLK